MYWLILLFTSFCTRFGNCRICMKFVRINLQKCNIYIRLKFWFFIINVCGLGMIDEKLANSAIPMQFLTWRLSEEERFQFLRCCLSEHQLLWIVPTTVYIRVLCCPLRCKQVGIRFGCRQMYHQPLQFGFVLWIELCLFHCGVCDRKIYVSHLVPNRKLQLIKSYTQFQ